MSFQNFLSFFLYSWFIIVLSSCFCNEGYVFRIPVSVYPVKSEYKIGDTLFFQVKMDRKMIFDTSNHEYYHIPEFNPYLQVHNILIDSFPTKDDLDTMKIISNSSYNFIYYRAIQSYGIRIDSPRVIKDSIIIDFGIILNVKGKHMMYFDSPINLLRNGFDFSDKCWNSITNAHILLLNENHDELLTDNHQEVIDKHFDDAEGVKYRSAKYYYNVVE